MVGSSGNEQLPGGTVHDIVIGGLGLDVFRVGSGDDILIAGRTTSDSAISKLIHL